MDTNFPDGFQERFFKLSTSNVPETLRRMGTNIYVPCGMKHTVVQVPVDETDPSKGMKDEDRYTWIECIIPFMGDDLSDEAAFYLSRYSDLRSFFYSTPVAQLEMQSQGEWKLHCLAVKRMFPKAAGEQPAEYVNFKRYRKQFWSLIKSTIEAHGGNFETDVPKDFFNSDWLVSKAVEIGCSEEEITELSSTLTVLVLNQIANGFAWDEAFFPFKDDDLTFEA